MERLISEDIENYCISKSSLPSSLCEEIAAHTRANISGSQMLIGPMEGSVLQTLIRLTGAKRVLEFGTYTGYSALAMAEALPDDGEVVTLDINEQTVAIGKDYWAKSSHGKKIQSMIGPALESLKMLEGQFDLVFIDADKQNYLNYLKAGLELLSSRGFVVVDNCLWDGRVLEASPEEKTTKAIQEFNDFVASRKDLDKSLLPIRDGMFVIRPAG